MLLSKFINQKEKVGGERIDDGRKFVKDNESTINYVAKKAQDFGDGMAVVGYGLTFSAIGAKIGIPLAAIGNGISTSGSFVEAFVEIKNEKMPYKTARFMVADRLIKKGLNKVLPGGGKTLKEKGFDLRTEILTQGVGLKVMTAEKIVDQVIETKQ